MWQVLASNLYRKSIFVFQFAEYWTMVMQLVQHRDAVIFRKWLAVLFWA
jgi:hypothetical protein